VSSIAVGVRPRQLAERLETPTRVEPQTSLIAAALASIFNRSHVDVAWI
jgi:hypothetical protein